uniref:Uncharacterized protein n=1 Tax=Microcystis aeruginosa (strain PCC 7806) TaxID=267872 RepID=A8YNJ3_MICA7|nr:unnamed protein product [Microcystis aeruginosa PCC 7806]
MASDRHLFNSNKLRYIFRIVIFQAKFNHFPDILHQFINRFPLTVTTPKLRNFPNIIPILIPFNDNIKLSLMVHGSQSLKKLSLSKRLLRLENRVCRRTDFPL